MSRQFQDRVPTAGFLRRIAHGNLEDFRVLSLQQVADILNATGRGDRTLSASDIKRIEDGALRKLRHRLEARV